MKYLADIFVAIFIVFFVLYSLSTKTKDYVKVFIAYFVPFIVVFLIANPIYLNIVKLPSIQSRMTDLFATQAYLNGYLATEVILYVLLVLVFKILFKVFTPHKLLVVKEEDRKSHKLIKVTLAIFLGYMMSFVLITLLSFFGFRTDSMTSDVLFETNFVVDISYVRDLQKNIRIYDVAEKADNALSLEQFTKAYTSWTETINEIPGAYDAFYVLLSPESQQAIDLKAAELSLIDKFQLTNLVLTETVLHDELANFEASQLETFNQAYNQLERFKGLVGFYLASSFDWTAFSNDANESSDAAMDAKLKELKSVFAQAKVLLDFYNQYLGRSFTYSEMETLLQDEIRPAFSDKLRYAALMEAYAKNLDNEDTKYLLLYVNVIKSAKDVRAVGLDGFMFNSIVSKYQNRLLKGDAIKTSISEIILGYDSFTSRFVRVLAQNEGFDLGALTDGQVQSLDAQIDKLQLNEAANAKMKQLYH